MYLVTYWYWSVPTRLLCTSMKVRYTNTGTAVQRDRNNVENRAANRALRPYVPTGTLVLITSSPLEGNGDGRL